MELSTAVVSSYIERGFAENEKVHDIDVDDDYFSPEVCLCDGSQLHALFAHASVSPG